MHQPDTELQGLPIPGDVLALLTRLQDLEPGFYMLQSIQFGWVTLRLLIDEVESEKLVITSQVTRLPVDLLELFTPVGIRLQPMH